MKSIMSEEKKCYVCGDTRVLHKHHIYGGTARRKISEAQGCWIYLCPRHHNMSDEGIHFNHILELSIKRKCQEEWEKHGTREDFIRTFGKSYL